VLLMACSSYARQLTKQLARVMVKKQLVKVVLKNQLLKRAVQI
jgi:hypothetical protein